MDRKKKEASLLKSLKIENNELKEQLDNLEKSKDHEIIALRRQLKELKEEKQIFYNDNDHEIDLISKLVMNPGFDSIGFRVFTYLSPEKVAKCREVCKMWKTFIDNDRRMLKAQVNHFRLQLNHFRSRCRPEYQEPILRDFLRILQTMPRNRPQNAVELLKEMVSAIFE